MRINDPQTIVNYCLYSVFVELIETLLYLLNMDLVGEQKYMYYCL